VSAATVLVTGASGTVARCLTGLLEQDGVRVRLASRTADDGEDRMCLDLAHPDPQLVQAAVDGVDQIFLYAEPTGTGAVLRAARDAGVRHVVLLSSRSVSAPEEPPNPIAARHRTAEREVAASGLAWTFLRPGDFARNALSWAPRIRSGREVRLPYPDAQSAPIHERDIAAVARTVLRNPVGHAGRAHSLTGPESLTQRRQVEILAELAGKAVEVRAMSPDEAREEMLASFPPAVADVRLRNLAAQDGVPHAIDDGVETVTGRPAIPFARWAEEHVEDYR
jgi:uncharacterized protein YbjT (DUF2867 family)